MSRSATNIAILIAGLVGGWGSALYSIQSLGSSPADDKGTWQTWKSDGGGESSPYAIAHYLLDGQIPPAVGLFRVYFASRDDAGDSLDKRCRYKVTASTKDLRWWSFSTSRNSGSEDGAQATITSEQALLQKDGKVEITVAPLPAGGNWVGPPGSGRMEFAFLVADDGKLGDGEQVLLPSVSKGGC